MLAFPIIKLMRPEARAADIARVEDLARELLRDRPELQFPREYTALLPDRLAPGGALHLDDLSEIPLLSPEFVEALGYRSRLRAVEGDWFATCAKEVPGYESYCRDRLGLGAVSVLRPSTPRSPLCCAAACWEDPEILRRLASAVRCGELKYIHPHQGTADVWRLAALLSEQGGTPVPVLSPFPGLSRWVNDKVEFAFIVGRLFGDDATPRTVGVTDEDSLAEQLRELAETAEVLVVKLPHSCGGKGIIPLESGSIRGKSNPELLAFLRPLLERLEWRQGIRLLVSPWQDEVLCAPSSQLWIPPLVEGPPVVEGIFQQDFSNEWGIFVGVHPSTLPAALENEIAARSWLLARLFQKLNYVGRCSFDLLIAGPDLQQCRVLFLECNGRWGGCSLPMTLMSRLFGDWRRRPYSTRICTVSGLDRQSFEQLLEVFQEDLYDHRSGAGNLILYSPGRLQSLSAIGVIATAKDWRQANRIAAEAIPERLRQLVAQVPAH